MRTDWRVVALLFCVGIFAAWQFAKIALPLADFAVLYGRDPGALAFLVSIVGLVGAGFGVVAGRLVIGFGARRALLVALSAAGGLSALQAFLPALWLMTALRIAEGFSHLVIVVAAPTLMAAAANDRDRPVAMGVWAMFFGIAFAIGAQVFPLLIDLGGLPLLFLAHAAGMVLLAFLVAPILPKIAPVPASLRPVALHLQTYGNVRTAAPALGFVFYTVTYLALLTFLPGAVGRPDFALTLPLISLCGTFAAGWTARYVPPPAIAIAGFAATAVMAVVLWSGALWAAYFVFLAQGAVPGACFANIPYLNASDEARSRATGAIAQMGNIGTTSGPPLFAVALVAGGLGGFLGLLVAMSLIGLVVVFVMDRLVRRQSAPF